jgi:hypothetical protein
MITRLRRAEKNKRDSGPLNNTTKLKEKARRDEVVQPATDNREFVFLFLLYVFVVSRRHDERLGARRRNKKSGEGS